MLRLPIAVVMVALCAAVPAARQADLHAITEFQRAADRYAFQHRQVERRLGGNPEGAALSLGLRMVRTAASEGEFFTPLVADAFKSRLQKALRTAGCESPNARNDFRVPRVHEAPAASALLPACLTATLPRLPAELEYRAAGVALLLVDVHADLVIDVLHGALPAR